MNPLLKQLSKEDLEGLLLNREGPCVSIFLPMAKAGQDKQKNWIRFKNLLREIERQLEEHEAEEVDVGELLAPLRRLAEDRAFWPPLHGALAVFRSPQRFELFRLPLEVTELAVVEDRFHLKPCFALLEGDGRFYILALSVKQVRLFRASRYEIEEVDLPGVPTSLTEALGEELTGSRLQYHSRSSARGRSPMYHGQGSGDDDRKKEVKRFFDRVDKGLRDHLGSRVRPLVLAGVDYLLPLYREATSYSEILEEGILGNPDELHPGELLRRGWELAEPSVLAQRQQAAQRYRDLGGTERVSNRIDEVVRAAIDGRVETLFVARGTRLWGRFDAERREVDLLQGYQPGSEDLLDLAAVRTFMNGGTVYAVPADQVPDDGERLAAVYRY